MRQGSNTKVLQKTHDPLGRFSNASQLFLLFGVRSLAQAEQTSSSTTDRHGHKLATVTNQ